MSEEQQQPQPKRRRPPPKRGRPGLKRPRTVFHLDDVTTMAPPEKTVEMESINEANSETTNVPPASNVSAETESPILPRTTAVPENPLLQDEKQGKATTERIRSDSDSNESLTKADSDMDLDGNTNQSGPWWTWAENQHSLEEYVMGKLDKMITKSERDEERRIMNHFDEQILMHQLLYNIEKKEAELVDGDSDDESHDDQPKATQEILADNATADGEANQISPEPEHPEEAPVASSTSTTEMEFEKENPTRANAVETAGTTTVPETASQVVSNDPSRKILFQRALPRWIPNRSENDGPKARLFTPQEFDRFVIQPLIRKLPCEISLEDCPEDPHSYFLKVQITNEKVDKNDSRAFETRNRHWDYIKATVEAFVRYRISRDNLRCLLEDGASFELELSLKVNEPMGVRFSTFNLVHQEEAIVEAANPANDLPPGLWINRVKPDKGLAMALGSHEAFSKGCAMLTLNGTTVQDPLVVRKLIQDAKDKTPNKPLSIKVCLSKYADLSAIPLSKLTQKHFLKRRDGKPIQFDPHPELVQKEKTTSQKTKSKKDPPKASSQPKTSAQPSSSDKAQSPVSDKKSPSPRTSNKFCHPSFPEHLQAPVLSIVGKEPSHMPLTEGIGTLVNKDALVRKSNMTDDGISDLSDEEEHKGTSATLKDGKKKKVTFDSPVANRQLLYKSSLHPKSPSSPHHNKQVATLNLDPFEVTLDTSLPLGGYFRTEPGQNFQSKCVILSVALGGQLNVNWGARIRIGTQVTAVMTGERRIHVTNHATVRDRYIYAKQHRQKLRLVLQNSHSCKKVDAFVSITNWTRDGKWVGKITDGWDGESLQLNDQSGDNTKTPNDQSGLQTLADRDVGQSMEQRDRTPSPQLGRFSPPNTSQEQSSFGVPSSLGMTMNDAKRRLNHGPLNGEEAFVDAVRNKSWTDLIKVIGKCTNLSKEFVQHVINNQYKFVETELQKSNSESSNGEAINFRLTMAERLEHDRKRLLQDEKIKDLQTRKEILKIYIDCIYFVEKAMTLRNWDEVTIQIQSLELLHLPSRHDPQRSKALSTKVQWMPPDIDLCQLPAAGIQHRILYSSKNEFSVHNNRRACLENREIMVQISEGDPEIDKVKPKELGQFILAIDEIESKW